MNKKIISLLVAVNTTRHDIDHGGSILLLNPKGQWAAVFSMPHDPKAMAMILS